MDKLIRIAAMALAVFLTAGCAGQGAPSPSPQPQPESEPQQPAASVLLYPSTLPEAASDSAFLKEALARGAVITGYDDNYTRTAATGRRVPDAFIEAVNAGQDARLEVYLFYETEDNYGDILGQYAGEIFESRGGALFLSYIPSQSWVSLPSEPEDKIPLESIELNEYGYLVYSEGGNSFPGGIKVVNDREIFGNADERAAMYQKYIRPVFYSGAMGGNFWDLSQSRDMPANYIWIFEDIYRYEGGEPWTDLGEYWPLSVMLETLGRYFDGVTREDILREKGIVLYDPEKDAILYEGGRGGGPFMLRATAWEQSGDLLSIHYENFDYVTGEPYEDAFYTLTVRLLPNGSFRYISNQPRSGKTPVQADALSYEEMERIVAEMETVFMDEAPEKKLLTLVNQDEKWLLTDSFLLRLSPLRGYR